MILAANFPKAEIDDLTYYHFDSKINARIKLHDDDDDDDDI